MKNNNKIIFLDIDGVMNSKITSEKYFNKFIEKRYKSTFDAPMYLRVGIMNPKRIHIKWLNYIIKKTKAKIVISSAWREDFTIIGWNHFFSALGIKGEVVGLTEHLYTERGLEIDKFLTDNKINYYVILDDDYDYALPHIKKHWVLCSNHSGLTKEKAEEAINILKK